MAAPGLGGLQAVRLGLERFIETLVEVDLDRLLADDCSAVLEQQRRNRVAACCREQAVAGFALDRYLVDEVVEAELGEAFADAARGRAPLGLVQLEHQAFASPTSWRSDSTCCCRLPQTASQSEKTPSSTIR